jgi:hypothetical protein
MELVFVPELDTTLDAEDAARVRRNFELFDVVSATAARRRESRSNGAFELHASCLEMWRTLAQGVR